MSRGATGSPFTPSTASRSTTSIARAVAEQVGAAGDPVLGLEIDEQQWRMSTVDPLVPSGNFIGTSTADVRIPLIVRSGNRIVLVPGMLDTLSVSLPS
jgi:hypothetical protein